jgi:hypothetical protein
VRLVHGVPTPVRPAGFPSVKDPTVTESLSNRDTTRYVCPELDCLTWEPDHMTQSVTEAEVPAPTTRKRGSTPTPTTPPAVTTDKPTTIMPLVTVQCGVQEYVKQGLKVLCALEDVGLQEYIQTVLTAHVDAEKALIEHIHGRKAARGLMSVPDGKNG